MQCLVCHSRDVNSHSVHDGIDYYRCLACGSISADRSQINARPQAQRSYDESYWREELSAARERSYGSTISRVAETLLYARIPVRTFLDIGSGPGYLVDALATLLPQFSPNIYGVELFPPPAHLRSQHPNYVVGSVGDLGVPISAGVCIEVIEHLYPETLEVLLQQLAARCEPQAMIYFNSAQPHFVDHEDPGYLDPFGRGHIISYSLEGLRPIFQRYGFSIFRLPGRSWGFLAEYQSHETTEPDAEALLTRLWTPEPTNLQMLRANTFGPMLHTAGIEAARCYLEADRVDVAHARLRALT
jgi:hypothetical protein